MTRKEITQMLEEFKKRGGEAAPIPKGTSAQGNRVPWMYWLNKRPAKPGSY